MNRSDLTPYDLNKVDRTVKKSRAKRHCIIKKPTNISSYLVKFVDPNKEYPVNYTIKQDGTKVFKPQMLKGKDLTENQILELFYKKLL